MDDAIVVGAGPNGLTAAARLASRAWRVLVLERGPTIGGGARTEAFGEGPAVYDVCSAAHPFGAFSPAFAALGLERHGLEWRHPPFPMAHPFDDGSAAVLERDVSATAARLGLDRDAYLALVEPLLARWPALADGILGPLLRVPPHPFTMARFGLHGVWSAKTLVRRFREPATRGLMAGLAAHSYLPLDQLFTAGIGLSLGLAAHAVGWPVAAGGSQAITAALADVIQAHGGDIETGHEVRSLDGLPKARATLLDVAPRHFVTIADRRLPSGGLAPSSAGATAPGRSRPTTSSRTPSRGPTRTAGAPARCTSAAGSRTLPPPNGQRRAGRWRRSPSPSPCSRRWPTRPGRRTASTCSGPTATCPTVTAPTTRPSSRANSTASRRDGAT
jgi:phytoene dehydrogenase-like protein